MNAEPMGDYVLVAPVVDTQSKGGIIMVQTDKTQRPDKGEVLAVGPGRYEDGKLIEPKVKRGDVILFNQYPNFEHVIDGKRMLFVREGQIVARVGKS